MVMLTSGTEPGIFGSSSVGLGCQCSRRALPILGNRPPSTRSGWAPRVGSGLVGDAQVLSTPAGKKKLRSALAWPRKAIRRGVSASPAQLSSQAPLEFWADLGDRHPSHNQKLATQHLARLVVVGQLAIDAAILAFLIPAKPPVRNGVRADELEAAQDRVLFRDLEHLTQNLNFNQTLKGTEGFAHILGSPRIDPTLALCRRPQGRFLPRTCRTIHRAQKQARTYCRTEQPRYGSQIANQQRVGAGSWRPEVQGEGGELEIRCCIPTDPMRCES